jgi:pyridoxamine 5'-phosphate oxidase family protein
MIFKPHEIDFLKRSLLGRLATSQPDGTLQNNPVAFTYNDDLETIDIAGYGMSKSQKYRNILHHNKVSFVVDDIVSIDPWRIRCLEIRGTAEQVRKPPQPGRSIGELDDVIIRVTPGRIISFGIDDVDTEAHQLKMDSRTV